MSSSPIIKYNTKPTLYRKFKLLMLTALLGSVVGGAAWASLKQYQLDATLITAIQHREYSQATHLLQKGADPNARKTRGNAFTSLLKHIRNLSVSEQDFFLDDHQTALMLVFDPNEAIARLAGLDYTYTKEATDLIRVLLEKGANANAMDDQGITVLQYALRFDHYDGVELLIQHGANVNYRNIRGVSLLANARRDHDTRLIQILMQAGAKE